MRTKFFLAALSGGALALVSSTAVAADFAVTVNSSPLAYAINGANNPTLNLVRGHTYTFDVETPGHPFYIKTVQVTGTGSQWTEGVTNAGATSGPTPVTFAVPADAPSTLFYQCSVHSVMTGTLSITDPVAAPVPAGGGVARGLAIGALALLGLAAVGRARRALMRARLAT
jgi:hypothetical protein